MTSFALELPQHDRGGRLKKKEKIEGVALKMEGNYGRREHFNFSHQSWEFFFEWR